MKENTEAASLDCPLPRTRGKAVMATLDRLKTLVHTHCCGAGCDALNDIMVELAVCARAAADAAIFVQLSEENIMAKEKGGESNDELRMKALNQMIESVVAYLNHQPGQMLGAYKPVGKYRRAQ